MKAIRAAMIGIVLCMLSACEKNEPITILVGFAPGGASTTAARTLARSLEEITHRTVLVESIDGAGGLLAAKRLMQLKPNGTSFMLLSSTSLLSVPPTLDLSYVALVATYEYVFVTGRASIRSLDEYERAIKRGDDTLRNVGTAGPSTSPRIIAERLLRERGIKMQHIGYKGSRPAALDAHAGHIATALVPSPDVLGLTDSLYRIAHSGSGIKEFGWVGILAPPGMSDSQVERWGRLFREASVRSEKRLTELAFRKAWQSGRELYALHRREYELLKPEADRLGVEIPK